MPQPAANSAKGRTSSTDRPPDEKKAKRRMGASAATLSCVKPSLEKSMDRSVRRASPPSTAKSVPLWMLVWSTSKPAAYRKSSGVSRRAKRLWTVSRPLLPEKVRSPLSSRVM